MTNREAYSLGVAPPGLMSFCLPTHRSASLRGGLTSFRASGAGDRLSAVIVALLNNPG